MVRRLFLSRFAQLAALPLALGGRSLVGQAPHKTLKIMMKSAWVPTIPPKQRFPFCMGWRSRKLDTRCSFSCWGRQLD